MYYNYNVQVSEKFTIANRFSFISRILPLKCEEFFLYIRKTLCILLVFTMFFNIFVTKNQELKDRFLSAFSCAINTIESTIFNEYTNALMKTINIAVQDLSVIIQKTLADKSSNRKNDTAPVSSNSSSDYVILTKRINDSYKSISFAKTNLLYSTYDVIKQGNILYKYVIVNCKNALGKIGVLLFILFSIFIVRKRDEIAKNISKRIVENRLAY